MRQREHLNPQELRELGALDRVLAGEPVDADLRELEDLVLDIRASAPEMAPGFAVRLEHALGEGCPAQAQAQSATPRDGRRWMLVPAAGTLAALALVLVAVIGPSGNHDGHPVTSDTGSRAALPAVADESRPGPSVAADGSVQAQSGSAPVKPAAAPPRKAARLSAGGSASSTVASRSSAAPAGERKVVRSALLVLEVPTGKVESTADGVIRTVDRFGGIVQSSSSSSSDGSGGEATSTLRIPTDRLDAALAALSKLGHVAERSQDLQDITGSFTSAQDRLADARAERRGLLRALGRATTPLQIESLRSRMRLVRSTIARLNGQLASLRRRAGLSTVQLTVRGTGKADEGATAGDWTPGDAAHDALRVLEVIAGVALIALAIAVPFSLLGVAIALGVRVGRRRRREGALDTP